MEQKILQPATNPVVTPSRLAAFGRFDLPEQYVPNTSPAVLTDDYALLEVFIQASTDEVEKMAQWAIQTEQVQLTLDYFPNTEDPYRYQQDSLGYGYRITPHWWYGYPAKDSIELVRRPVQVPALTGTAVNVTSVSLANNVLTVHCVNTFAQGDVVVLGGTAEGNVLAPIQQLSTVPFLNGVPLTILTVSGTQFTAAFNNFYTTDSQGNVTPGSYTNNSDTGTAQKITNPVILTYYDPNGILCTWSTIYYYVAFNKITLTINAWWPQTDRRQDCIQISYWAGSTSSLTTTQHARLQMAVMYLANHMWENRTLISVEPTSEVWGTLCKMVSEFRSFRIPR